MILKTILIGFIGLLVGASCCMAGPRNVLFIAVDDLKPWLGCYDHPVIKTPNIDRIAKMGTVFRNNYCQLALCGPTRISTMTGLRPDTTKIYNMGNDAIYKLDTARKRYPLLKTLPGHFKENGYTCYGYGKVFDSRNTSNGQDAQSWSDPKGVRWDWDYSLYPTLPMRGGYQSPKTRKVLAEALAEMDRLGIKGKRKRTDYLSTYEGSRPVCEAIDVPDEAYAEYNVMAAPTIKAIERFGKNGKPFFLAVGFYKPHLPFVAPKKYWDLYSPKDFELAPMQNYPANGVAMAETPYNEGRGFHPVPEDGPISEELQRHMLHGYAACVSYVDAQVGKLLSALEQSGLMDDTIICLWGDHGFHLGDKEVWGKHTNFEQATRAPLIISSPSISGGIVEDVTMTEFVDVFPTLCELAELEAPAGLDGKSLVPLMRGKRLQRNAPAVSQYLRGSKEGEVMGWAIRTPRYRYVEWRKVSRKDLDYVFSGEVVGRELYDYKTDPNETRNLSTSPEYRDILEDLVKQFDEVLQYLPKRDGKE